MVSIPKAPNAIQKGYPLKNVLGEEAVQYLAKNLKCAYARFPVQKFVNATVPLLEPLEFKQRGVCIAEAMRDFLPGNYNDAINIILASLTPPNETSEGLGLSVLFYQPHGSFIEKYGLDTAYNGGEDPFDISLNAMYEITRRFTAEFSIRPFLMQQQDRTLAVLHEWASDADQHVRRLCSEGTRPRLPWAQRIPAFMQDPSPILPLLQQLKDDQSLYVRRSVANSLGDIAKDHPDIVFTLCEHWLQEANKEMKWLIRHALRHPAKKGVEKALALRRAAK